LNFSTVLVRIKFSINFVDYLDSVFAIVVNVTKFLCFISTKSQEILWVLKNVHFSNVGFLKLSDSSGNFRWILALPTWTWQLFLHWKIQTNNISEQFLIISELLEYNKVDNFRIYNFPKTGMWLGTGLKKVYFWNQHQIQISHIANIPICHKAWEN